ncbi:MAG: adenylyltransferase/cytidyltransferase family protein, partial [Cytophagales bacterium]|nr:adenylyltransferase/cytidyltransferase family protein [Armatimonadota bacterium]
MILGKFLPPHRGHQYLVDFARRYADRVTVHVCSIGSEPIPGALRFAWMREHWAGCPDVTVVHCDDLNPQTPEECPDRFWEIWRESLLRRMDTPPDLVFASEPYGFKLAETLGATYVPVDHARDRIPISGTRLRADPLRHWEHLL